MMKILNGIMEKNLKYRVFSPHPVAALFKEALNYKLYNIMKRRTVHSFDDMSFANYYFHDYDEWCMLPSSWNIYNYPLMDYRYYRSPSDISDD